MEATVLQQQDNATPLLGSESDQEYNFSLASFIYFKKGEWKQIQIDHAAEYGNEKIPTSNTYVSFVYYAACVNPRAAFEFRRIADHLKSIKGPYNKSGSYDTSPGPTSSILYIEDWAQYTVDRWTKELREYGGDFVNGYH
jgi:hypothetical protein